MLVVLLQLQMLHKLLLVSCMQLQGRRLLLHAEK